MNVEKEHISQSNTEVPLVPKGQEEQYYHQNNIEVRRLPNGITVMGAARVVDDEHNAEIQTCFKTGAVNDPPDKIGLHHLSEHLAVNPLLSSYALSIDANMNAFTTSTGYGFSLSGIANPEVKNFGVWPLIGGYAQMLIDPLSNYPNPEEAIKKEKAIVLRELAERNEQEEKKLEVFRNTTIFACDNPMNFISGGTPEGIENIRQEDVEDLVQKVMIPDGTIVSVFSQGDPKLNAKVAKVLAEAFANFPREASVANPPDETLNSRLNPNFKAGAIYDCQENETKNVRQILFVWKFEGPDYSQEAFAIERLTPVISKKLHDWVREQGLSYGAFASASNIEGNYLWVLQFPLGARENLQSFLKNELARQIQHEIATISDIELDQVNNHETLRQLAVPMPIKNRFGLVP